MTYCGTSLLYNPLEGPSTPPKTASDLGVSDGTRTRDILDHNQVLYQLSYTHHAMAAMRQQQSIAVRAQPAETSGSAGDSDPWWRAAIVRRVALSGPGGATKTASR